MQKLCIMRYDMKKLDDIGRAVPTKRGMLPGSFTTCVPSGQQQQQQPAFSHDSQADSPYEP